MPTKLSVYDQTFAGGAGKTAAFGDVPFVNDSNGTIIQKPGVGALRTIYSKYNPDNSQQSGTSDVDVITQGATNAYGTTNITSAVLQAAASSLKIHAVVMFRNVAYYDTTCNSTEFRLVFGSTNVITLAINNSATTGIDYYFTIDCDINLRSYSNPNVSISANLGMYMAGAQLGGGANAWAKNSSGTNVDASADRQLYLYHRATTAGSTSSYYRWYNQCAYVWAIP